MSSSFGTALRVSVFGQSHGAAVGALVEGLPAGFAPDLDALRAFVARRSPGRFPWDTRRQETDAPRIVSGLNAHGATCGAPLCILVENADTRSADYGNLRFVPRPGHADYPAWVKWRGENDIFGGGHFSARVMAPLTAAGGIALQILEKAGIRIAAHLLEVDGIADAPFTVRDSSPTGLAALAAEMGALADGREFPVIDGTAGERMKERILAAQAELDSVGGICECVATGLPVGAGSPLFDSLESQLARVLFGIPAVKGIEFGAGFDAARMRGSTHNDPYEIRDGAVMTKTDNAGGILGGLSTGMPLRLALAFKPISSIGREQDSVDLVALEPAKLTVHGRHDVCAAIRAVPIVEAACALVLLDALLQDGMIEV
ncbi:MAG: chorismate synthase [Atopobiaceae bacterium]|nr:chorismate synthase [Atopobiaceae bacterium]